MYPFEIVDVVSCKFGVCEMFFFVFAFNNLYFRPVNRRAKTFGEIHSSRHKVMLAKAKYGRYYATCISLDCYLS